MNDTLDVIKALEGFAVGDHVVVITDRVEDFEFILRGARGRIVAAWSDVPPALYTIETDTGHLVDVWGNEIAHVVRSEEP